MIVHKFVETLNRIVERHHRARTRNSSQKRPNPGAYFPVALFLIVLLTSVTGCPDKPVGRLQVIVDPEAARTAGGQWQVDNLGWRNSEYVEGGLAIGEHTITFKEDIPGWLTPPNQIVSVIKDRTVVATGVYVQPPSCAGTEYLAKVMDQHHEVFYVYSDADSSGNHFVARGRMPAEANDTTAPPMQEDWPINPYRGVTCIKVSLPGLPLNWGGWYFMNGALTGAEAAPHPYWGNCLRDGEGGGEDLSGATLLTFWARGEIGGERVQFFCGGVGYDVPPDDCADSLEMTTTGYVTLSTEWTMYTIDLTGKSLDRVLGGFGWVSSSAANDGRDIAFYLDDIAYNKARLDELRLIDSYESAVAGEPDSITRNAAFIYDNALALLAFIEAGLYERAQIIADAFVYAQNHDRTYNDGRLRNAYQGGSLKLFPGWTPNGKSDTVRIPGWFDAAHNHWYEDEFQVSTHTGNLAWVMIAMLAYYETNPQPEYLDAVVRIAEWILENTSDERGCRGFTAGIEGWEPHDEYAPFTLLYKATEHNIDLYAAFRRLYLVTGDNKWCDAAEAAKAFVLSMWDDEERIFYTGTLDDGIAINDNVIPVDIQAWAVLALADAGNLYWDALDYAEAHHRTGCGFDFDTDLDGIWFEGTAQMSAARRYTGAVQQASDLIACIEDQQRADCGIFAANKDGLTTGFDLPNRNLEPDVPHPWLYYQRVHVGATAWYDLAARGANPFWIGRTHGQDECEGGEGEGEEGEGEGEEGEGEYAIEFTQIPDYGSSDLLYGEVSAPPSVACDDLVAAVYIKVEGTWWTKPYFAAPLTTIQQDCTWQCPIVTGGSDPCATEIAAYLLPAGIEPPSCGPCDQLPDIPGALAFASDERTVSERSLSFAGYEWKTKRSDCPMGPGPNYFSNATEDVWVDTDGLHLTISEHDGTWYCSEVILDASLGYGIYTFQTRGRVDILDPNMVLGLFTWDTGAREEHFRELDIEFGRWGNAAEYTNAQYVVQPCDACPGCADHCTRFRADLTDEASDITHYMIWSLDRVVFKSYYGSHSDTTPPENMLIHSWSRSDPDVPEPGNENVRFNLWLFRGNPPAGGQGAQVVITDFAWSSETQAEEGEGEEGEGEQEQVADYTYEDFQLDNVCTYANNWCGWADVVGKAIVYGQMAIDLDVPPWCTTLDVTVHTCCNGFGEGLAGPNGSAAEIVVDDTVRAVPIDSTMNYHHGMYYRYESCAQFTQTFDVTGKTSIHLVLRMLNGAKLDFEKLTVRLAT